MFEEICLNAISSIFTTYTYKDLHYLHKMQQLRFRNVITHDISRNDIPQNCLRIYELMCYDIEIAMEYPLMQL